MESHSQNAFPRPWEQPQMYILLINVSFLKNPNFIDFKYYKLKISPWQESIVDDWTSMRFLICSSIPQLSKIIQFDNIPLYSWNTKLDISDLRPGDLLWAQLYVKRFLFCVCQLEYLIWILSWFLKLYG